MSGVSNFGVDPETALRVLCRTQTQLLVAENSAMPARMAAALSHELNTPLGVLVAALQTQRSVLEKVSRGERFEPASVAELEVQLDGAIGEATDRIREAIHRMQRVANLYGATTGAIATDELVTDIIALVDPTLRLSGAIEVDLEAGVVVECRPEQIAAVISALMHHLLETERGAAGIQVRTSTDGDVVTIAIAAPALVLAEGEIACLLDPTLESSRCTWNLYSSRQILLAHGGDLAVSSTQETGTVLALKLPKHAPDSPNSLRLK